MNQPKFVVLERATLKFEGLDEPSESEYFIAANPTPEDIAEVEPENLAGESLYGGYLELVYGQYHCNFSNTFGGPRMVTGLISKPGALARELTKHPYAWPGGYPRFAICEDGGCICPTCCGTELDCIDASTPGDGWQVQALDINWETELYCDHCGMPIDSAYGGAA